MVDDPYNCLSLYSVSLNANLENNAASIVCRHAERIAFAHIGSIKHFEDGGSSEAPRRDCGGTGILDSLKAYHDTGWEGCIRWAAIRYLGGIFVVEAVIFDMDGLMFDTERLAKLAWQDVGAQFGVSIDEEVLSRIRGATPAASAQIFRNAFGSRFDYPTAKKNAQCLG